MKLSNSLETKNKCLAVLPFKIHTECTLQAITANN